MEKVLHHPEHPHSMCVCEINSFREEIKVKTDAGQKDDKFFLHHVTKNYVQFIFKP